MKILFIAGWVQLGEDDYVNLNYIEDEVTFFFYNRSDKLHDVESRLMKEFSEDKYDWVIANSMGAFFASRLLARCLKKQNVLFLCPYIETTMKSKLLAAVPFDYFPTWAFFTNMDFHYKTDFFDLFRFGICQTQLLKAVNKQMNTASYIKTYKAHNVNVIYGTDDNAAKMSPMTIASLMSCCKVYPIYSRHSPHLDDCIIQRTLKRLILTILSNPIVQTEKISNII